MLHDFFMALACLSFVILVALLSLFFYYIGDYLAQKLLDWLRKQCR